MITKRIIPCLDVRNGRVVKGTNFEGIRDVADPVEMARMYNAAGADELVFYDITASFEGRARGHRPGCTGLDQLVRGPRRGRDLPEQHRYRRRAQWL